MIDFEDCKKSKKVIKKSLDKQMSKSLVKLAKIRLSNLENLSVTTLKIETYYEAIKELITALISIQGYKSYSPECLISFIKNFEEFNESEILFLDQLRIIRHDITYRGVFVEDDYLIRNKEKIDKIINKLLDLINQHFNKLTKK